MNVLIILLGLVTPTQAAVAPSGLNPDKVFSVGHKKAKNYIRDGLFVGGDATVDDVTVKDIRFAKNLEYERIVLDLPVAATQAPYFQVDVSPEMSRIVVTVFGKIKQGFDPKLVARAFGKSAFVQSIELLPQLEKDRWTFALHLKEKKRPQVEVFDLNQPVRAILDLKP